MSIKKGSKVKININLLDEDEFESIGSEFDFIISDADREYEVSNIVGEGEEAEVRLKGLEPWFYRKELIDVIQDSKESNKCCGGYREFFIVMPDYDTFIIRIYDIERPNEPDDDQIIAEYMNENYYGHSYKVIDKDNTGYETVDIK